MKTPDALLVIDMQLVAFDGKVITPITNGPELLDSVSRLIDVCRSHEVHIVYLQTCAKAGRPYARNTHGWEIHPRLSPHEEDRIVLKPRSSGFDDTVLKEVLDDLCADTLFICGIWSEFCVANTSRDAVELGFSVLVASDGHGTAASSEAAANEIIARQNRRLSECGIVIANIDDLATHLANR